MVNFGLSIRLLLGIVGQLIPLFRGINCLLSAIFAVLAAMRFSQSHQAVVFTVCFIASLLLLGVIRPNDIIWLRGLLHKVEN
jgi:hypothetical protein